MNNLWNEKDKRLWEEYQDERINELQKVLNYSAVNYQERIRLIQFVLEINNIYGVISEKYRKQFERELEAFDDGEEENLTEKIQECKPWETI